jgi:hypothetical protein
MVRRSMMRASPAFKRTASREAVRSSTASVCESDFACSVDNGKNASPVRLPNGVGFLDIHLNDAVEDADFRHLRNNGGGFLGDKRVDEGLEAQHVDGRRQEQYEQKMNEGPRAPVRGDIGIERPREKGQQIGMIKTVAAFAAGGCVLPGGRRSRRRVGPSGGTVFRRQPAEGARGFEVGLVPQGFLIDEPLLENHRGTGKEAFDLVRFHLEQVGQAAPDFFGRGLRLDMAVEDETVALHTVSVVGVDVSMGRTIAALLYQSDL